MKKNLNRIAWKEAATGGLYLGLVYVALSMAAYFWDSAGPRMVINGLTFFAIAGFLYAYARRMSAHAQAAGFPFGRCFVFVLQMSLFAGVLAGLGQFVLANWIDPEGFQQQLDTVSLSMSESGLVSEDQAEQAASISAKLMRSPLFTVIGGIFNMIIYGGLLGLIVSLFVKRPADPFADEENI